MSNVIEIPRYPWDQDRKDDQLLAANSPAWDQPLTKDGAKCKPIIRCNCGLWCGIGLHHVHADGTVTASFFHAHSSTGLPHSGPDGCGWHVFLKLKDYDGGEFLPEGK